LPRTTPLIAVPLRDTLALLGTNFGQPHTPAWVYNLEADPHVRVSYRGVTRDLVVRPPSDEEAQEIWAASRTLYGGYEKYRERISGRAIRLFVLEAA
jgi:deazaflavin-dependent oxidoreductase (nitroreductase family)